MRHIAVIGTGPAGYWFKAVSRRYESTALADNVRFVGNVTVGAHAAVADLRELYNAVVLATGAPADRPLGIPAATCPA